MLRRFIDAFSAAPPRVRVVDGTIEFTHKGRCTRTIVAQLTEVGIMTTADGPFGDDVFWVLKTEAKSVTIPWSVDGESELLAALQALPGFDNEVVVAASGSTQLAAFQAWVRDKE